jgi:hypothetical protein
MYNARLMRTHVRKPMRATDILGLALGAAFLLGALSVVVFVVPKLRPATVELSAEEIAENARKAAAKVALAYRQGSILFVEPDVCQEHSFDNWTGAIEYKEQVDCDDRLAKLRKPENDRAAERMRSVVEGFRR